MVRNINWNTTLPRCMARTAGLSEFHSANRSRLIRTPSTARRGAGSTGAQNRIALAEARSTSTGLGMWLGESLWQPGWNSNNFRDLYRCRNNML